MVTAEPTNQNNAAALRGATLAFRKPPVKPKPIIQSIAYQGSSQALAAATMVGKRPGSALRTNSAVHMSPPREDLSATPQYNSMGSWHGSAGEGQELVQKSKQVVKTDSLDYLHPQKLATSRPPSPSHIAATLAVSRSSSISPSPAPRYPVSALLPEQSQAYYSRPLTPSIRSLSPSRNVRNDIFDDTPVGPTSSLIGMFELAARDINPTERPKPGTAKVESFLSEINHPRPVRPQLGTVRKESVQTGKSIPSVPRKNSLIAGSMDVSLMPDKKDDTEGDISSDGSFVSVTDHKATLKKSQIQSSGYKQTGSLISNKSHNSMAVDSFANAIVASSLASSRAASPANPAHKVIPPPPPPTRRGNPGLFHLNHPDAQTRSPAKGLRQTMRKPLKADEDSDMQKRGHKGIMKKRSNKKNGDSRKRWRDSVTERERKRYEAVWASNKGLFVSRELSVSPPRLLTPDTHMSNIRQEDIADLVSNIVVRDIWSRSRLGNDILAEVWKLVDRRGLGRLARDEFVAGMWLIDQRLKGRKLPIRLSSSVWASVGGLGGIKVTSNGQNG